MAQLSRRGLFQAFRSRPDPARAEEAQPLVATIGEACVEPKGVTCRRCGDECEPKAISFRLVGRGRAEVRLDSEACTGCGTCLAVCPTAAISLLTRDRAALIAGLVDMRPTP